MILRNKLKQKLKPDLKLIRKIYFEPNSITNQTLLIRVIEQKKLKII